MAIDPFAELTTKITALSSRENAPNRAETLKALAGQFESLLLSQMLREMQAETNRSENGGENYGGALSDTMYGELSNALVGAGGLGLATSLEDAMARTTPGASPADAIAEGHGLARPYSPWTPGPAASIALDRERVSSAYGLRRDPISGAEREHKGIDIPAVTGDAVRSVRGGTVIESDNRGGYGNTVVVDHGGGVTTRYAHLSSRHVSVGDRVAAGQQLGQAGQTGRATGTHLHLEVRQNGVAIDPLGEVASRLIGNVMPGIEREAVSADDTHGASR